MAFEIGTKERYEQYVAVIERAEKTGFIVDRIHVLMDIESADRKFDLRMEDWLAADGYDFLHDFVGILNHVNRDSGFPATDFGDFVPRFSSPAQ